MGIKGICKGMRRGSDTGDMEVNERDRRKKNNGLESMIEQDLRKGDRTKFKKRMNR